MKKSLNSYVGDELANKVKVLSKALNQAELIILKLEEQNKFLTDTLNSLVSHENQDCDHKAERICA